MTCILGQWGMFNLVFDICYAWLIIFSGISYSFTLVLQHHHMPVWLVSTGYTNNFHTFTPASNATLMSCQMVHLVRPACYAALTPLNQCLNHLVNTFASLLQIQLTSDNQCCKSNTSVWRCLDVNQQISFLGLTPQPLVQSRWDLALCFSAIILYQDRQSDQGWHCYLKSWQFWPWWKLAFCFLALMHQPLVQFWWDLAFCSFGIRRYQDQQSDQV